MGAFGLAVELWRARLNVDVPNALAFNMPVKLGLEPMDTVGPDALHAKREGFQHMIDTSDRVGLVVARIDL